MGRVERGLTRLRRHSFKAYTTADGPSNETAWTVFEDGRGDLWVGTNDGLNRVRDGRFTTYGTKDGTAASGAVSIAEDAAGRLWFASTLGLTSLEGGRFTAYARREGLREVTRSGGAATGVARCGPS